MNANVFLHADNKTLSLNEWPPDIKNHPESLHKCKLSYPQWFYLQVALFENVDYDRAASMLQPAPYPESYPKLAKLDLLQIQAAALAELGHKNRFYRPPQTTRFEDGPNSTGVMMHASTGSGMDTSGLNDGSKSSTLVNYISDAWNWGAEMYVFVISFLLDPERSIIILSFCECEVRFVKKAPTSEGYIVFFSWYGSNRRDFRSVFDQDLMWVHAKKCVFFGAGALGTPEILLRSKQRGLPMSPAVGKDMSGNGDILGFGYNTDYEVNAIARLHPNPKAPVGPTITGIIDCRDQDNALDGFVIEEGAVPAGLASGLQILIESTPGKIFPKKWGLAQQFRHFISSKRSWIFGPYANGGSAERTQVYLIMSHDSNQANLTLDDSGRPVLEFLGVGRGDHVPILNDVMAKATSAVGGTFVNNPFFATLGKQEVRPILVFPLLSCLTWRGSNRQLSIQSGEQT